MAVRWWLSARRGYDVDLRLIVGDGRMHVDRGQGPRWSGEDGAAPHQPSERDGAAGVRSARIKSRSTSPGLRRWHLQQKAMASRSESDSPSRTRAPSESDLGRIRVGSTRIAARIPRWIRVVPLAWRSATLLSTRVTSLRRWRASLAQAVAPELRRQYEDVVKSATPLPSSCPMPVWVRRRRTSNRSVLAFFRIVVKLRFNAHSLRQIPDLRSIAGREGGG
jgi:hypothetical protein